jgi:hypothetical protein
MNDGFTHAIEGLSVDGGVARMKWNFEAVQKRKRTNIKEATTIVFPFTNSSFEQFFSSVMLAKTGVIHLRQLNTENMTLSVASKVVVAFFQEFVDQCKLLGEMNVETLDRAKAILCLAKSAVADPEERIRPSLFLAPRKPIFR